jgi:hypothetical protein
MGDGDLSLKILPIIIPEMNIIKAGVNKAFIINKK